MYIERDQIVDWLVACADILAENRDYLGQLDAAIGDADHGANMDRGFKTVLERLPAVSDKDIGTILKTVGMTLLGTVGGAGGPFYGTFFINAGMQTTGKMEVNLTEWANALEAALNGIMLRGRAEPGDKTMVDALNPAVNELKLAVADALPCSIAMCKAAEAARQGMEATAPMLARKGRASYLGERSIGHLDPGATSSYLIIKAAADTWNN